MDRLQWRAAAANHAMANGWTDWEAVLYHVKELATHCSSQRALLMANGWTDWEAVLYHVKRAGYTLQFADAAMKRDREVVLAAMRNCYAAMYSTMCAHNAPFQH